MATLEDYKNAAMKNKQRLLSKIGSGQSGTAGTGYNAGTDTVQGQSGSAGSGSGGLIGKLSGQTAGGGTSAAVSAAQDYLKGVASGKPSYESSYTGQIADLYEQIMNRPKFSYDPNQDPLYNAYKDQYMRNGQLAMRDVMGTAAGLTGGYGNSWADSAGFQAYQAYLQGMNDALPQLEERAYERYQDEEEEMLQRLALAQGLEESDYSKYQNALANWQASQTKQTAGQTGTNSIFSKLIASIAANSGKTSAKAQGTPTIQGTKPKTESINHNTGNAGTGSYKDLTEEEYRKVLNAILQ